MSTEEKIAHPKRKSILIWLTLSFLLIAIILFLYWWIWARFNEYTDDAYVSGNLVYVTPQVGGIVTKIYADDTWYVQNGQVLIELDKTDYLIALDESKANLAQTVRHVAGLFAEANKKRAEIRIAKAQFIKDAEDYERRAALVNSGSVSKEDLSHALAALTSSYFHLISAEQGFFSSQAKIEDTTIKTHPLVEKAKQKLKKNWVNLNRCTVKAPQAGFIAQRRAQVGEKVNPSEFILAVVPLEEIWIDANFKEDQIGSMQIGQKAKVTTDIYGKSVIYEGEVIGMGAGTGSIFSLLPPQNATGNWIKIVQRVPIRIALAPCQILDHPLRLGLSTEVNVDIHPLNPVGDFKEAKPDPVYSTAIFDDEEMGSLELINTIILENLPTFPLEFEEDIP